MDVAQADFFWTDNYANILDIDVNDLISDIPDNFLNLIDTTELLSPSLSSSSLSSASPQTSPALSSPSPSFSSASLKNPDFTTYFGSNTPYSDATKCKKKSTDGHIKRPMNPFMIFAQGERMLRGRTSSTPLHNALISKYCGFKWKSMTAEEKKPFREEAARLKLLHKQEFPEYKYKPKKKIDASPKSTKKDSSKITTKKSKSNIPKFQRSKVTQMNPASSSSSPSLEGQLTPPLTISPITADTKIEMSTNYELSAKTPLSPIADFLNPSMIKSEPVDYQLNQPTLNIKEEQMFNLSDENKPFATNNFNELFQLQGQQLFKLQSPNSTTMFILLEPPSPLSITT